MSIFNCDTCKSEDRRECFASGFPDVATCKRFFSLEDFNFNHKGANYGDKKKDKQSKK